MRLIASKLTMIGTFVATSVSANSGAGKGASAAANAATGRRRTTKRNFMPILYQNGGHSAGDSGLPLPPLLRQQKVPSFTRFWGSVPTPLPTHPSPCGVMYNPCSDLILINDSLGLIQLFLRGRVYMHAVLFIPFNFVPQLCRHPLLAYATTLLFCLYRNH